jgi:hypothetical protein
MFDQFCNASLAAIIAGLGKIFVAEVVELGMSHNQFGHHNAVDFN